MKSVCSNKIKIYNIKESLDMEKIIQLLLENLFINICACLGLSIVLLIVSIIACCIK